MYKIVLTHYQVNTDVEQSFLPEGSVFENKYSPTEEDLIHHLKDADAVISAYEPFTRRVIESLPRLKVISQASTGFNNVDLQAATEHGIAVINNPFYCAPEVADHTVALILALERELKTLDKSVQEKKEWRYDLCPDVIRLSERTLGLFGFGNIAREVAKRAKAFGMKIMTSDPYINMDLAQELGARVVDMDTLLRESDILSIHAPLTEETQGYFNKERFRMMERKPLLINAGRGPIIVEADLIEALDLGLVRGAGLDVLESENPDLENSKLIGRSNVLITPHVAYYSKTSQYEIQRLSAHNIALYFQGKFDELSIVNKVRRTFD